MTVTTYMPGEVVDITVEGARVVAFNAAYLTVVLPQGDAVALECGSTGLTVNRVAPAEWPPRPGDLWRDRCGVPWFAFDAADYDHTGQEKVLLCSPDAYGRGSQVHP